MSLSLVMAWSNVIYSQEKISGKVVDDLGGGLPGATVLVKGTNTGVTSDFDGNFEISANSNDILIVSYLGFATKEIRIVSDFLEISLDPASNALDEVVVAGVAGATSKKKLSVTVNSVSAEQIQDVPASNAAGALLGKVAGVSITNLGRPGQGSTIILRGAANFYGSQEPLVILDGVFVEGGLADINVDDIASFEIVKGASASALYGSRAGNGVIVVTSKRGKIGKTEVTLRQETGFNKITRFIDTNQSHGWELASDWQNYQGQFTKLEGYTYPSGFASVYADGGDQYAPGAKAESEDNFSDNPYGVYNNHQDLFFTEGIVNTTYASVSSGNQNSRSLFSYENYKNEGVVQMTDGYLRQTFRANLDFNITDNLKFSASNSFITINDRPGLGGGIFRTFTRLSPDANLLKQNPDGSPYWFKPDPHESEINNPLYELWNYDRSGSAVDQNRFLGGYNLQYNISSNLNAELEYAFESNNYRSTSINPYDTYQTSSDEVGFGYSKGSMSKYSFHDLAQKLQATINFVEIYGDLEVKAKASYLLEDRSTESFQGSGIDFLYQGLYTLDNFEQASVSVTSDSSTIRAQNYFGIVGLVFKEKYILDGLYRKDGSSLFGENEKWNDYYRISGAYRISEDITIPGVDELKVNYAIGTSGQRPGFNWQYEQVALSGGTLSSNRLKGNPDLRPSLTTEREIGLNASLFNGKVNFEGAYSNQITTDQFMLVSLFSPANAGKNRQWQNVGELEANTLELSLNTTLFENQKVSWDVGANYSKTEGFINELSAPQQQVGPDGLFYLKENTEWGSMWGRTFVDNLDEMAQQLPAGKTIADYSINSDGLVVETASIGTANEKGIIKVDEAGTPVVEQIGNQQADFRVGITSNLRVNNFTFYMLWDWKQGGDIYNRNTQWNTISERSAIVDQSGKAENEKKARKYYGSLYDVNQNQGFWVEDGSFLKLREVSLTYNFPKSLTDALPFTSGRLSLIGRNVLQFTNYSGWDPEVSSYDGNVQQNFAVDYGVYPTQATYSLSLNLKF